MESLGSESGEKLDAVESAYARAALYGALALAFRPATEETSARLVAKESAAALAYSAAVLGENSDLEPAISSFSRACASLASPADLLPSFRRFFGHTARGSVPPYETEYGGQSLFQQPQELADLAGFYLAFGLTLKEAERERADHISCECEFLCFLALKEAYALQNASASTLEETRKATRLFLRDHLGRFAPTFAARLASEDRRGFYGASARLCAKFIHWDCSRVGVQAGPRNLSLRAADDDRVPMACGSGAECMAMPGAGGPGEE